MPEPALLDALFYREDEGISFHRTLPSSSGDPIDFTFETVNPQFERLMDLRSDELSRRTVRQVVLDDLQDWLRGLEQVAESGQPASLETYCPRLERWLAIKVFRHESGVLVSTVSDATSSTSFHQKNAEDAAMHHTFFDMPNGMKLIIDVGSQRILQANPKAAEFYGWSQDELRTMTIGQINTLSRLQLEEEMEAARTEKRNHFRFRHRVCSGEVREVQVYSSPGIYQGRQVLFSIIHDVTEEHEIQRRLLQRERLSAIGQLTASLYHEFGNLLGILFSHVQLMEEQIPEGEPKQKLQAKMRKQLGRAQRLIDSVKRFARNEEAELQVCRISPLLDDLLELEAPQCRQAHVEVGFASSEADWVRIDQALVQQVFLNLFKNAFEAVQTVDRPRIMIEVKAEGSLVRVRFGNNGPEISPQAKKKLFTPFFTTKRGTPQGGTGLGLSFSSSIVRQHGGELFLEDGPGTVFQVRLPRHSDREVWEPVKA